MFTIIDPYHMILPVILNVNIHVHWESNSVHPNGTQYASFCLYKTATHTKKNKQDDNYAHYTLLFVALLKSAPASVESSFIIIK